MRLTQAGEQSNNITRTAWLHAGFRRQGGCLTLDAQCGSAPGWWKGGMQMHLAVAKDKFDALPKSYQAALRARRRRPTLRCWPNTTPPILAR